MADVYGGFDFMAAGNALSQMQSAQQARQSNALQMQYTAEDRAREARERSAAAGNARAELARKQQFMDTIKGGYMPAKTAVMGPGTVQGNTPASFDPEKVKNELLRRGDLSGLVAFSNAQEQLATQKKVEAEATGQGLTNEGIRATNTGTDYKNTKEFIDLTRSQIDAAPDIASLKAIVAATFTPGHPMAKFNELNGLTLEQSMAAIDGLIAKGYLFPQIREQMSQGASKAAENIAARGLVAAQTGSAEATTAKTEAETKAAKDAFTIENVQTATGPIKVKVFKDGRVERLKLGDETLAPEVTPVPPTQLEQLQTLEAKLRAANPNDPRLVDVKNAIERETTKTAGVTVNTGEKASEKTLGEAGSAIIKNAQAIQNYPSSIASLREVKKLIPSAKDMLGGGAETLNNTVNFLNNRLGTNINVKGLTAAAEIRSRLFEGVIARLKQMDSQPSQIQQAALAEALGTIDTDPDALAKVIDVWIDEMQNKVKTHNTQVDKVVKSGNAPAGDWKVDLPEPDAPALVPPTVSNWK